MLKRGNILATADIGITVFEPRLIKNDHFLPVFNHRIGCWKSFNKTTQQPHLRSGQKVSQPISYTVKNTHLSSLGVVSPRKIDIFEKNSLFRPDFKRNCFIWDVFKSEIYNFQSKLIKNRQQDLLEHRISDFITDKVGHRAVNLILERFWSEFGFDFSKILFWFL